LALPFSRLAHTFGFTGLSLALVGVIAAVIATYLLTPELGKRVFYRRALPSSVRAQTARAGPELTRAWP
jgi:hypothetical protein